MLSYHSCHIYASKDFHLAIGGRMGCMNWLKYGAEKGFIFHAIMPALYPFNA